MGHDRDYQWPVERKIQLGFAMALLILLVIGGVAYRNTRQFIATAGWVDRTNSILQDIEALHLRMVEAESGARGYAITGDARFMPSFQKLSDEAWKIFAELEKLVQDPGQARRLGQLKPLIVQSLSNAQAIITSRRERGLEAAYALVESGAGKQLADAIQRIFEEMKSAERSLLAARESDAGERAARTIATLISGAFLAVVLVILTALFIQRDINERKRNEQAQAESQLMFQDFLDHANDLIYMADRDGQFLFVNRKWRDSLDYDAGEVKTLSAFDVVHPDHRERVRLAARRVLEGGEPENFDTVLVTRRGENVTVSGHISARLKDGRPVATRGIFRDITQSKLAELELQRSNEVLLKSVTELEQRTREIAKLGEMGDVLQSCQSLEEAYLVVAQWVPQIMGAEHGSLAIINPSRNLVEIVAIWGQGTPGERVFVSDDCWALRRGRMNVVEDADSALRCRHVGEISPAGYLCIPLVAQGEALGLLNVLGPLQGGEARLRLTPGRQRLVGTVADRVAIALANLKLREAMKQQSVRDPLTGLFNRRHMEESLEREVRRAFRSERSLGILMLDLDHFKQFNDSFGHDAGDAMLREFGNMLSTSIRGGDIACRYGGEEFALILPEANLEVTRQRAEFLREKARHLNVEHRGMSLGVVTLSAGVAAFPEHGKSSEVLLRTADSALYAAKLAGRDRVVVAVIPPLDPPGDGG